MAIAADILRGLNALHAAQPRALVHRDLKPSNVLLGSDGIARLGDFGFSRVLTARRSATASTRVIGSDGYLAPQYAESQSLGPPSDMYSFGVTLMRLLTGAPANGLVTFLRPFLREPESSLAGFMGMLQPTGLAWSQAQVIALARLCHSCLVLDGALRPSAQQALLALQAVPAHGEAVPMEPAADPRLCSICLEEPRAVTFHCGHFVCCAGCAPRLLQRGQPSCPLCRAPLREVGGAYWVEGDQTRTFVAARMQTAQAPAAVEEAEEDEVQEGILWAETPEGAETLQRLRDNDATLTSLNLSCCCVRDACATQLAGCLRENTTLTSLDLEQNYIGAEGVTQLAGCLRVNTTLTSLNLYGNNIGDEGMLVLRAACPPQCQLSM